MVIPPNANRLFSNLSASCTVTTYGMLLEGERDTSGRRRQFALGLQAQLPTSRVDVMALLTAQRCRHSFAFQAREKRLLRRFIGPLPWQVFYLIVRNQIYFGRKLVSELGQRLELIEPIVHACDQNIFHCNHPRFLVLVIL